MKPNSFDHFFKILGLSPNHMNVKEIEKAYKKAALKCHPDRSRSIEEKERNAVTYNFITTTKDLLVNMLNKESSVHDKKSVMPAQAGNHPSK